VVLFRFLFKLKNQAPCLGQVSSPYYHPQATYWVSVDSCSSLLPWTTQPVSAKRKHEEPSPAVPEDTEEETEQVPRPTKQQKATQNN